MEGGWDEDWGSGMRVERGLGEWKENGTRTGGWNEGGARIEGWNEGGTRTGRVEGGWDEDWGSGMWVGRGLGEWNEGGTRTGGVE